MCIDVVQREIAATVPRQLESPSAERGVRSQHQQAAVDLLASAPGIRPTKRTIQRALVHFWKREVSADLSAKPCELLGGCHAKRRDSLTEARKADGWSAGTFNSMRGSMHRRISVQNN